ncbi:MAG: hypothetical protein JXA06_12310 [Bacteroidetes bacterium]|nr:hypothetical protein [Bacteroidota bacterium]
MKAHKLTAIFFIAALLSGCSQTLWISDNFKSAKPNIDNAVIIFPELEFTEREGDTKQIRTPHSVFVSKTAAEAVKEIINEGNFTVKKADVYCDTLLVGKWIRNQFSEAKNKYTQMRDAVKQSKDKKILPASDELKSLISKANSDYIIVITGLAYGTSEQGKRDDIQQLETFDLLYDHAFPYDYQWNGLQLQISLIDARTMEILWYNYNKEGNSNYDPFNKDEVKNLCSKLMKPE